MCFYIYCHYYLLCAITQSTVSSICSHLFWALTRHQGCSALDGGEERSTVEWVMSREILIYNIFMVKGDNAGEQLVQVSTLSNPRSYYCVCMGLPA